MTTTGFDTRPVLDLLAASSAAWATGDAGAYGALFTDDADYITWFGHRVRGGREIAESHRELFARLPKGPAPQASETPPTPPTPPSPGAPDIRFLGPEVAVVVVEAASPVRRPGEEGAASVVTYVAVRQAGGWRFASFQNTRKTPMPGWNG